MKSLDEVTKIESLKTSENTYRNILIEAYGNKYILDLIIKEKTSKTQEHYFFLFRVSDKLKTVLKGETLTNAVYNDSFSGLDTKTFYNKLLIDDEFIKGIFKCYHYTSTAYGGIVSAGDLVVEIDKTSTSDALFKQLSEYIFGQDIISERIKKILDEKESDASDDDNSDDETDSDNQDAVESFGGIKGDCHWNYDTERWAADEDFPSEDED